MNPDEYDTYSYAAGNGIGCARACRQPNSTGNGYVDGIERRLVVFSEQLPGEDYTLITQVMCAPKNLQMIRHHDLCRGVSMRIGTAGYSEIINLNPY